MLPSLGVVLGLLGVQFVDDSSSAALASFFRRFLPSLGGVLGELGVQFVGDKAALASFFRRFFSTFRRFFADKAAPDCVSSPSILLNRQQTGQRAPGR